MEENKVEEQSFYKRHKAKFNFAYMVIICLVIAKLITSFVFISVVVDGSSMEKTLQEGDKGITDGVFYKVFGIDRFDIVIVKPKKYDGLLVKRVIGLPGETIEYKDSVLYVNGEIVEEEFLTEGVKTESYYGNDIKITLKDNEYYVLGDNRLNSSDSRSFGAVTKKEIKGAGMMLFAGCKEVNADGSCSGLRLRWPKFVK